MAREHRYHAEASALYAQLRHPLNGDIKPLNGLKLSTSGGYISEHAKEYRAQGVVTFRSAHSHVAGHQSQKEGGGWITLTTSTIEHLNVLEVVTADRVVSQISTEHPLKGHVPTVTFLGTRFENLRVAGIPLNLKLRYQLGVLRPPDPDTPYLEDGKFLADIGARPTSFPGLRKQWDAYLDDREKSPKPAERATGTLAYDVSLGDQKVEGNVLSIPEFGKIILAELTVDCDTFHLTMLRLEMGCLAHGTMSIGGNIANGTTEP